MADVKIGAAQLSKPAPLNYRRFMNAYIIVIIPALTAFIATWGFSSEVQAKLGTLLILSSALVKGFGMLLGNGQIYSPSNAVVDDQASKN
jgi:hypothetical protein